MNGRFRRDCMRCASRAGRIESVKLAEVSSCCVVRGGLPCLMHHATVVSLRSMRGPRWAGLLDEVGESQWM